jgi:DNA primase
MTVDLLRGLKRMGSTHGGEYAGPCPFCGGTDRFRVWPEHPSGKARWWCRQCSRWGDHADLLRALRGVPMREALRAAGVEPAGRMSAQPRPVERPLSRPTAAWQQRAEQVAQAAEVALWEPAGAKELSSLQQRGLTCDTIRAARLGYIAEDLREPAASWGLPPDHKPVWAPRGICLPWRAAAAVWRLNIRRPSGTPKYIGPAGFCTGLYGADGLHPGEPAVLVEGEFDALSVVQETGFAAVASGSTCGARHPHWQRRLGRCSTVLVAFDADDAGEQAARWWLDRLPTAVRLVPAGAKDANGMLAGGVDLRAWVADRLSQDCRPPVVPAATSSGGVCVP